MDIRQHSWNRVSESRASHRGAGCDQGESDRRASVGHPNKAEGARRPATGASAPHPRESGRSQLSQGVPEAGLFDNGIERSL